MPTLKLYEHLITKLLAKKLDESRHDHKLFIEELDSTESSSILALYLKNAVEHGLRHYKKQVELNEQLRIANGLISRLKELTQDDSLEDWLIAESKVLRGMYDGHLQEDVFKENIPLSSISKSSLFTGGKGDPQVYRELKREIATADKVDLLVSFIKYSGLRLIFDDLVEHTKTKPLRVITTSYMGATDLKAVKMLADLPNTQVRISYDTKRTRLHAKAYYFDRDTGFSTAYIGSSNLSKAALSEGTEWNMKVSEYTSSDIIQKFRYTFETYWNMSEFMAFDSNCDADVQRLKYALSTEGNQTSDFEVGVGYFDLKPFTYQQEILDQLAIERTVHHSYRNLVVAATGTGKTMVAAFDFKRFFQANPQAKLLFLAHREEILKQSMASFRGVLRDANFGELWVGGNRPCIFNHVFGSIQTLTSSENLTELHKNHFDYIVLDDAVILGLN